MFHVDRAEDGQWPWGNNDQQDMALLLLVRDTGSTAAICQPSQNRSTDGEPLSQIIKRLSIRHIDILVRENMPISDNTVLYFLNF